MAVYLPFFFFLSLELPEFDDELLLELFEELPEPLPLFEPESEPEPDPEPEPLLLSEPELS